MNFTVSLDSEEFDHKPDKRPYGDMKDRFGNPRTEISVLGARVGTQIKNLNIQELGEYISKGRTWSPFVFRECPDWKRRRRLEGLFESTQTFALDFDNNESLEFILSKEIPIALIHESFSSTEEYKKYRAIIVCSEEIKDFLEVKKISIALALLFNSDKSCVDAARLYFGSTSNSIVFVDPSAMVSREVLLDIVKQTNADKFITKSKLNESKDEEIVWGDLSKQEEIFNKLKRKKLNSIKRKIRGILLDIEEYSCDDKRSRYECIWRNTSRLARMPELTGIFVKNLVLQSIESNENFNDWEYSPLEVIISAIKWSASHVDEPV